MLFTREKKKNRWIARLRLSLPLAAVCLVITPVLHAAAVRWKSATITYSVEGKDIKDVLRDFAASQGIPAKIGEEVTGSVSGRFRMSPQRFLNTLASTFGFIWYYNGQVLEIITPAEMKSTVLNLDSASTDQLQRTLEQMGVADARFPLVYDDTQGVAIVNGPPSYVQIVTAVADRLDLNAQRRMGTEIRVFPLHYAWADDRNVQVDGQPVTVLGVASLLNRMYHSSSQGAAANGMANNGLVERSGVRQSQPVADVTGNTNGGGTAYVNNPNSDNAGGNGKLRPPLPPQLAAGGLLGGLTGKPSLPLQQVAGNAEQMPDNRGQQPLSGGNDELPVIAPDPRTNSVLIRDLPGRMFQYPELLSRLDVKPRLIEIEAHIIEINDDALQQLGVDWTAHNSHVDIQTGNGALAQNTFNGTISQNFGNTTLPGNVVVPATPNGLSLAAVLGDAGRYLMTRINALTQTNQAKIDASPKVTTLDNLEAVMDNKTQFFVPVTGFTSADLYTVSTGVSLRVLPMVIDEPEATQIKLDVAIEDGQLTSQMVGNIPIISSTHINTSAFITQGQALLIAGYRVDDRSMTVSGVPWLSKIPILGALFRRRDTANNHMERLFLLTPRIIEL